jgi:hypothetical protein
MKTIIAIPSHLPHLKYVALMLAEVKKFCQDPQNLEIKIIVSEHEATGFKTITNQYSFCELVTLKQMIQAVDNVTVDEKELVLNGKYYFQALKKIYAAKYFDSPRVIVWDSENKPIAKFHCKDLHSLFETKNIFYCDYILYDFQKDVTKNSKSLLKLNNDLEYWMFETSFWYFDKNIVNDLFKHLETLHQVPFFESFKLAISTFEWILYCWFIYANNDKYQWNFICNNEVLRGFISEDFESKLKESQFTTEYTCTIVNEENVLDYCGYLKKYQIPVARLHWMSKELEKIIINNSNVKIGTYHY